MGTNLFFWVQIYFWVNFLYFDTVIASFEAVRFSLCLQELEKFESDMEEMTDRCLQLESDNLDQERALQSASEFQLKVSSAL